MSGWSYNGYADGESRVREHRPRKTDQGHSIVKTVTTRRGSAFAFTYRLECQCGKSFSSRQSSDRTHYAYVAHLKREGVIPS